MTSAEWQQLLAQSATERIEYLYGDTFWEIPTQMQVLQALETRLAMPDRQRPHSMLLIAGSGMGKTAVVREFAAQQSSYRDTTSGQLIQPVLSMELPPVVKPRDLLREMLVQAGCACYSETWGKARAQFERQMPVLAHRVIIVDEANRLARLNTHNALTALEVLKWVSGFLRRPVVLVSTPDILPLVDRDQQLKSRFVQYSLDPWQLDDDFAGFVQAILEHMPLRDGFDSKLHTDSAFLAQLLDACASNTGQLISMIQHAAANLIRSGEEWMTYNAVL